MRKLMVLLALLLIPAFAVAQPKDDERGRTVTAVWDRVQTFSNTLDTAFTQRDSSGIDALVDEYISEKFAYGPTPEDAVSKDEFKAVWKHSIEDLKDFPVAVEFKSEVIMAMYNSEGPLTEIIFTVAQTATVEGDEPNTQNIDEIWTLENGKWLLSGVRETEQEIE